MDVFFSLGYGEGLAPMRRNQVELADFVFRVGVGIGICVAALPCRVLALREEGDPFSIGGPLGVGVVSGLRELDERFAIVTIEPEVRAEDLLIPVSAIGDKDYRVAVGREFDGAEADRVEEVVEREFGFALSKD